MKTKIVEFRIRSLTALDEFYMIIEDVFTNFCYNPDEYVTLPDGGKIFRTGPLKFFAVIATRRDRDRLDHILSDLAVNVRTVLS